MAFVLLLSVWYLRSILLLGFLAVILAIFVSIPAGRLQRHGWPRGWSTALSFAVTTLAVGVLGFWTLPTIIGEAGNLILGLPDLFQDAVLGYDDWRTSNDTLTRILPPSTANADELADALLALGITTTDVVSFGYGVIRTGLSALPVLEGVSQLLALLTNLSIVFFIAIFLLVEPRTYIRATLLLVPAEQQERLLHIWNRLYRTLTIWLTTQLLSVTITMLLVWVILGVILRMPFAPVVAVFAGFATFIPNIGVFLPVIPIIIFTLADDPGRLPLMVLTYLAIQLVESNIITPSLVKVELSIPSGAVLFFQVIAATLFGPAGILLAVPLLAVLLTVTREIYTNGILGLEQVDTGIVSDASGQMVLRRLHGPPSRSAPAATAAAAADAAEEAPPPAAVTPEGAD